MRRLRLLLPVLACLLGVPVAGENLPCATGPELDFQLEVLDRWVRAKELERQSRIRPAAEPPPARVVDGMFMLEATPGNSPLRKPFDLHGTSLLFTPDGEAMKVQRIPLQFDSDRGQLVRAFVKDPTQPGWNDEIYTLRSLTFPFFGQSFTQLHISPFNAIFFDPPPRALFYQHGPLETITGAVPLIAPLLVTEVPARLSGPLLYVKETSEHLTITWRAPVTARYFHYEIQARLSRSGEILFSYRDVQNLSWGSVVVTSGRESWRSRFAPIATLTDPSADVDPRTDSKLAGMLDIERVELNRIGESNLLQLRLQVKSPIDRAAIRSDSPLQYYVDFSSPPGSFVQYLSLTVYAEGTHAYYIAGWEFNRGSPAARIDGNVITVHLLQDHLALLTPETPVFAGTSHLVANYFADMMYGTVSLLPAPSSELDFTALDQPSRVERPLFESFVAPVFNPRNVWDQLKRDFNLRDDQVDGLAVYQTFMTDIVFFAGAYSTVGNPGVDGIGTRTRYGRSHPRVPALLHMHVLDYGWNETERTSGSVSLHEFGHRWLYHVRINESGVESRALNPVTPHPAEYVHTPAPFIVYSDSDASTMGGARWTDHGDGTFTAAPEIGYFSYSWSDLYLMGLAPPAEVEPWFYIADADPELRKEYTPRPGTHVRGIRRDVEVQQFIDAMGPRVPSHHESPRSFHVYFVLVTEPGMPATADQLARMEQHRRIFETNFRTATANRADVKTLFLPPGKPRQRPARR